MRTGVLFCGLSIKRKGPSVNAPGQKGFCGEKTPDFAAQKFEGIIGVRG
jgi:hypothetical protein